MFIWLIVDLLFSCAGAPLLYSFFLGCFWLSFYVRPGHVFRKPYLIYLRRLDVFGLNSAACKYWASSCFEFFSRMLFTTFSYCCVPRGISHIPVFLFLFPLNISFPFFWVSISCLSSLMVHPSSHKTPNDINGAVFIFGNMWICLT